MALVVQRLYDWTVPGRLPGGCFPQHPGHVSKNDIERLRRARPYCNVIGKTRQDRLIILK